MSLKTNCSLKDCRNLEEERGDKLKYICKCCNLSFCTDECLIQHIVQIEGKRKLTNVELNASFIKKGEVRPTYRHMPYYNFENFQKVKIGDLDKILGAGAFGEVFLAK